MTPDRALRGALPSWPPHRRIALALGIGVWLVYVTTAGGTLGTGDAVAMFEEATSIVTRGAMDVPSSQSSEEWRGIDGRYYTPFGILQSLYDIPFMLAGRAVADQIRFDDPAALPKAFVALASTVPVAVAVAFGFLLAWRLSSDLLASFNTALALGFGTLLWPYSKLGSNAALASAVLAVGVYATAAGWLNRRPAMLVLGGAGLGLAILTRHELALAALTCLLWLAWQGRHEPQRTRVLVAASAGVVAAAGVWCTLNFVRFGNPFMTGHRPTFASAGLLAFLTSPSGSLFLYSPVAVGVVSLVSLSRRGNALAQLLGAVTLVMAVFYASLEDWLGTRSYGPRYLVPLLPMIVAPLAVWWSAAASRGPRLALGLLCAISIAVQLPAIAVDFSRAGIVAGQPPLGVRRDEWRWAPLRLNAALARETVPSNFRYVTGLAAPPPPTAAPPGTSLSSRLAFSLDAWWLYLFYLGALPRLGVFAVIVIPLGGAVLVLLAARRWAADGGAGLQGRASNAS